MSSLPENYQSLPAVEKLELLWQRVGAAPYPADALPTKPPGGFARRKVFTVRHNRGSFEHIGDEMPPGRAKLVHAFGAVAVVRLEITDEHPYTGLFATGGRALMRTSDASGGAVFTPTHALKFLIDGRPSVNVFANQAVHHPPQDYDLFSRHYANALPAPNRPDTKLVAWAFQRTADALGGKRLYAVYLPLHNAAEVRADGAEEPAPVVPDRIELHPTGELHLSPTPSPDWRSELGALAPEVTLFDVRLAGAIDEPAVAVGRLVLERPFVASRYGDESLFFQHDVGPR
ncbi:hypothetical protein [Haliangium sp.]|uniref:hypothetical protein n=1 Tax=Haliangium sp. TaxID=2663208 RepID=UPI003D0C618C